MYKALIKDITSLSHLCKQDIGVLYQNISMGQTTLPMQNFTQSINECCHIHHQDGHITACFGCSLSQTEHLIIWQPAQSMVSKSEINFKNNGDAHPQRQAYAWCIWDAFFICQKLQKPALIISKDPISGEQIQIEFDGQQFSQQPIYFSFPLGKLSDNDTLRSCFCCRTKAFTQLDNAKLFAQQHQCEIIDWAEMLSRTDEMVQALAV